jgi:hypothetical protein
MTMAAEAGSTSGTRQFDNKVKRAIPSVVHMIAGAEDAQQSQEAYDAGKFEVCAWTYGCVAIMAMAMAMATASLCFFLCCAGTFLVSSSVCAHVPGTVLYCTVQQMSGFSRFLIICNTSKSFSLRLSIIPVL